MATDLAPARSLALTREHVPFTERHDVPRRVVQAAAVSMIGLVVVILGFIAWNGSQLFLSGHAPLAILGSRDWNPSDEVRPAFGLLPFVAGTVAVTTLAVVLATPLATGLAFFMAEIAPGWARAVVQPALEIFVGIPSVVWGWLGLTTLVPFLRTSGLGFTVGFSWLAGSLVLTVMILPTITSVAYDAFRTVPGELRTASLALGSTRWQTMRHVVLPAALSGVLTAVVLGMARAAGEALAVQMVIGNRTVLPSALTQPMVTLTSQITMDMGNTVFGEPWNEALWTMSLLLLLLSLGFVLLVRYLNARRAA
ncbi:MAG TPA: phosphate ABC transporter permease subunit PstC [Candidatus Limnocylindrales bacterium]